MVSKKDSAHSGQRDSAKNIPAAPFAVFIVIGKTGVGKSSFIKLLGGESTEDGREPTVDDGIDSCTQNPTMYVTTINNQKIMLLDTPGFDDSGRENLELLNEIISILYLLVLQKNEFRIHGIIFLHDISEVRFSGSQRKTLSILRALCGEECMGNVIVGTTRWSPEKPAKFKKEEEREKNFLAEYWRGIYRTRRWIIENDNYVPLQIVNDLLAKPSVILLAQKEMLKPPHAVGDTTVGKLVIPEAVLEMEQLRREFTEREETLKKEMAKNSDEAEVLRKKLAGIAEELEANTERDKKKLEQLQKDFDEKAKELVEKDKKIEDDKAKMKADAEKQKLEQGYFNDLLDKFKEGNLSFAEKFGLAIAAPIVLAPAALVAAPVGVIISLVHLAQKFVE